MRSEPCRISLNDTLFDIIQKMSEGNPGALSVLVRLSKEGSLIDPDDFFGGLGSLMHLDSLEIYSSRIWMLYKDVCKESIEDTVAMLRANQLGFLSRKQLDEAIDTCGRNVDVQELKKKVQERLPKFGAVVVAAPVEAVKP